MRPGLWPAEVIPRCEMVRADPASRHHVLASSSLTFGTVRTDAAVSRSQIGVQNGALRRRTGAELSRRGEDELARSKRIRRLSRYAHRLPQCLSALHTPLTENSNDFGLLCAQVYASSGNYDTFVGQDQHRASSQPVDARQAGSARLSDWPARA